MELNNTQTELINILNDYHNHVTHGTFKELDKFTLEDISTVKTVRNFVRFNPDCLFRENLNGHMTGSTLIVNQDYSQTLLTYHRKLKKWLQLGGHADGQANIRDVAFREAIEESGIKNFDFIQFVSPETKLKMANSMLPFDVDCHFIPKHGKIEEHFHYDFRYLLVAWEYTYKLSYESIDLKWVPISDMALYTSEQSMMRLIEKLKYCKGKGLLSIPKR